MDTKYILITIIIGLLIMPFASAIEDATSIGSTNELADIEISSGEVRNAKDFVGTNLASTNDDAICIAYLEKNKFSDTPKITCARLMKKDLNCIEFLKENNVQNPAAVCNKFFGTPQVTASSAVQKATISGIAQTWRT